MHIRTLSNTLLNALLLLGTLSVLAQSQVAAQKQTETGDSKPRLAVIIVIDQMRADYLTRWKSQYTGGLHRLASEGTVFTNAIHDHAATVTATGHATISTGCLPSHHGIVGNKFYDRTIKKSVGAVEDETTTLVGGHSDKGSSPSRLLCTSVGDWLKEQSPHSKVVSASLKDRAAILMGGKNPDAVYWYDSMTGNFITSTHYPNPFPAWTISFNSNGYKDFWVDSAWNKYDTVHPYQGADTVAAENDSVHTTFPHSIYPDNDSSILAYHQGLWETPFADELLLKFGESIIANEGLGKDDIPDLLCLSLSSADIIGHAYGPDSHEIQDYYLRCDQYLGRFFGALDTAVGQDQYVVVLSSDHGVCPFPEIESAKGNKAARRIMTKQYRKDVNTALAMEFAECPVAESLLTKESGGFISNLEVASRFNIDEQALSSRAAKALASIDYVGGVITYEQMASPEFGKTPIERLFQNSFHPDRSPDIVVNFKEWVLLADTRQGTTHGAPYHYDTNIPIVVYGRGIRQGSVSDTVRTIDIAPTLAQILGIIPPAEVDGKALPVIR